MLRVIPLTVIVYCEECTVARFYLQYLREAGYIAEKVILLLNSEKPRHLSWAWSLAPRLVIAQLRRFTNLTARAHGELREFIDYVGQKFEVKVNLTKKFAYADYCNDFQIEMVDGFYDEKMRLILERQENKLFLYTCGGLVKKSLLSIPDSKFLHIHPGVVPDVKGSDGFWWSLLLKGTPGASCFYMNSGIDTGDIIMTREYALPNLALKNRFSREVIQRGALVAIDPHIRAMLLVDVVKKYEYNLGKVRTLAQSADEGDYYFHMHASLKNRVIDANWA